MRLRLAIATLALLMLAAAGCRPAARDGGEETGADVAANTAMAVTVAKVVRAPMRDQLTLLGETAALRKVTIRAPAAGRLEGFGLQVGDRVRRGQVIARIISREAEAAKAGAAIARRLDPEHAAATDQAVRRFASEPGIAVRSPENAIVAQPPLSNGQIVAEMDSLVELIDPAGICVQADAPIDVAAMVKPAMRASVSSRLHPGVEFAARVAAVSPSFNQGGATVPIRIEFTAPARIDQAGASVEVRITTQDVPDALVIPAAAIFQDAANGTSHVFVVGPDGRAHRTAVTIGIHNLERVQITRGLEPGQTVITSGGYALSDGLAVRPVPSGR